MSFLTDSDLQELEKKKIKDVVLNSLKTNKNYKISILICFNNKYKNNYILENNRKKYIDEVPLRDDTFDFFMTYKIPIYRMESNSIDYDCMGLCDQKSTGGERNKTSGRTEHDLKFVYYLNEDDKIPISNLNYKVVEKHEQVYNKNLRHNRRENMLRKYGLTRIYGGTGDGFNIVKHYRNNSLSNPLSEIFKKNKK
jgi:hypothetical protein